MRRRHALLLAILAALLASGCAGTGGVHGAPGGTPPTGTAGRSGGEQFVLDIVAGYLLDAAAADFDAHGPEPARFRNVRFGTYAFEGKNQYLVCGEFEATGSAGKWTPFATLKTTAYEQWIGDQPYCNRTGIAWEARDLSAELLRRLDVLR